MSHRQSCNRCRQQKVRCLRDEAPRGESNPSSSGRPSLSRCERCTKAGVECVYSLTPTITKQRSTRRHVPTPVRRDIDPEPKPRNLNLNSTLWFEQGLAETLYPSGPTLGANYTDLVGQFPGLDETGTLAGFPGWDEPPAGAAAPISTAPSTTNTTDDHEDSDNCEDVDVDDDKDPTDALSSQLSSLGRRATRAMRRLVRPGRAPLTVSSPEVSEALEDTNTLIRIINNITAANRDDITLDLTTTTDYGVAFSALACHQHLVALFRAICNAIHRCLQTKRDRGQQHSEVGPSAVAQFVMVLQLLLHLINRMDRSLFQNDSSLLHGTGLSTSGDIAPVTVNGNQHTIDFIQSEVAAGGTSPPRGLLVLVQDIVGTIPNDHEKLRQVIQQLQSEIEQHSELH
ncbi:hypothetical protein DL95DRAFT_385753 [Leptodontidium sp. 2 PMI_412]|nr:hypothetical protein DL95DRAFT_385753 [Leptodontidium sp. 2 PMI_412]